jgi:hypothetical protein
LFLLFLASPVCDVFVNSLPTLLGSLIWRPHPVVFFIFVTLRIEEAVEGFMFWFFLLFNIFFLFIVEHCGFELPFSVWSLLRDNGHHDFHHSHNIGCYGTFGFWDSILGTDSHYREFQKKQGIKPSSIYSFSWPILFLFISYCFIRVFVV